MSTTVETSKPHHEAPSRDWNAKQRVSWWAKWSLAVAIGAGVSTFADVAHKLGLSMNLETKTASAEQHTAMVKASDEKLEKAIVRFEVAINAVGIRIDNVLRDRSGKRGGGQ